MGRFNIDSTGTVWVICFRQIYNHRVKIIITKWTLWSNIFILDTCVTKSLCCCEEFDRSVKIVDVGWCCWSPLDKAFFDVRVLHPGAMSNENKTLEKMYSDHEKEKKRLYNSRVIEVEHGKFTPLVFSTTGGMSRECTFFLKKLSEKLSQKSNQKYSDTISYVRKRLRVE